MVCPDCAVERADYQGPGGAWLPGCPNCGSRADPEPVSEGGRRIWALASALEECWMAGEQMNMDRPPGERIDWLRFARAVENRLARAVDTGDGRGG